MQECALVDHDLLKMVDDQNIFRNFEQDLKNFIQPASLDIPITSRCYLIKEKFLPFKRKIADLLESIILSSEPCTLLLRDHTYLCYCGFISLPSNLRASFSPKSSIGRIDVLVRTIFDNCGFYDTIEKEQKGNLWVQISPRSFNIKIYPGLALTQMMLFEPCQFNLNNEIELYSKYGSFVRGEMHDNALIVHLDTRFGYEALNTNEVIDLSLATNDPSKFFRTVVAKNDKIILEKDKFYIFATIEKISIPLSLSAEMVPFVHHIGDLRSNKAGYFDSGFLKSSGVLEICPHETISVYEGQPIALMKAIQNKSNPLIPYNEKTNNYQFQQGPVLSKYFTAKSCR